MLKQLIQAIDSGSTLAEIKISLLDAPQIARAALDSATAKTVTNCFRGERLSLTSEDRDSLEEKMDIQEHEEESLDFLNLEEGCSFKEYVNFDSSLQLLTSAYQ